MKPICFIVLVLPLVATDNNHDFNAECGIQRLPRNVVPTHYQIAVQLPTDIDDYSFNGSVKIDINSLRRTDLIILHSKDLEIDTKSVTVESKIGSKVYRVVHSFTNDDNEVIYLILESPLPEDGSFVVNIPKYSGKIQRAAYQRRGLYIEHDFDYTDKVSYGSFFEPTYARMVFPCFDEPDFKAKFTVSIERPAGFTALSNMPINITTKLTGDRYMDVFEESPLISTYSLAMTVNKYSRYPQNETLRTHIVLPEDDLGGIDTDFIYEVAENALKEMESYTGIKYPLSKLDHVGFNDYPYDGMEHFGILFYPRKFFRIWDSAHRTQEMVHFVIHNVVHQWFGVHATMEWWSDFWLEEAIPTYLQYVIGEKMFPNMGFENQFFLKEYQNALHHDEQNGYDGIAAPLSNNIKCNANEAYQRFREASNEKGTSVLRMFRSIVGGEDHFQAALRLFLNDRSFKTAAPDDFFRLLDKVNISGSKKSRLPQHVTFESIASTWTKQAGAPLVTVIRDYKSGDVQVYQERSYDKLRTFVSQELMEDNSLWWIPLTWTTSSRPFIDEEGPLDWLYANKTIHIDVPRNDWLLFNTNVTGYYRVNYDEENWSLLAKGLEKSPNKFHAANRAQLLDDVVALCLSRRLDIGIALNMTQFLFHEDDPFVWMSAVQNLEKLYEFAKFFDSSNKVNVQIHRLAARAYDLVRQKERATGTGTDFEEHFLDRSLRESLRVFACRINDRVCFDDRSL